MGFLILPQNIDCNLILNLILKVATLVFASSAIFNAIFQLDWSNNYQKSLSTLMGAYYLYSFVVISFHPYSLS